LDNGGEFNNNVLSAWINSKGITPERSVAYHHYQNGTIERYNRTLQDMGRMLLIDSGLPKNFWALAFVWACYTLNRIPNVASGNITPFEKMFLYAPNLDRLQSFGSQAFAHVPHEKRQKLDNRAVLGYVVYYLPSSKGWGFWVPSLNDYVELAIATFPDYPSVIQPSDSFSFADILELQLGSFEDELTVQQQDETVAEVAHFVPKISEAAVPSTYKQAFRSDDRVSWTRAMGEELDNLWRLGVWEVRTVPLGKNILKAKWVFVRKTNSDGHPIRFKARYVAKGFAQVRGEQFGATFAPTATFVSMLLIFSLAVWCAI
jgi:hypothetical protein